MISLTNDTAADIKKCVWWKLKTAGGEIVRSDSAETVAKALCNTDVFCLEFNELNTYGNDRRLYLEFGFSENEKDIAQGVIMFCPHKYFEYEKPNITTEIKHTESGSEIHIATDTLTSFIELKALNNTVIFSDNFFTLGAGQEKVITCCEELDEVSINALNLAY